MDEKKYWLWLSMVFGAGSRRIWQAMRLFETAGEAYEALSSGSLDERLDDKEIDAIRSTPVENAVKYISVCSEMGIGIAAYCDDEYPPQLRHILNPPAVIYYKGNISCLKGTRTVTSVGARKASAYSLEAASRICRELAKSGVIIVSGFALGIDIASHMAAVSVNRPTACVLGCGIDVNYPKENFSHRDEILNNGGVFISEFPPGTSPFAANFPKRNRILAALGRAAMVFEASEKSGSLITAGMAMNNGRDVFCLPPADIFNGSFSGNIMFLRDGARQLFSSQDVLDCFKIGSTLDKEIRMSTYMGISRFGVDELNKKAKKAQTETAENPKNNRTDKKKKTDEQQLPPDYADENKTLDELVLEKTISALEPEQRRIVRLIADNGAMHADEISQKLEMNPAELMTAFTELEILGVIRSLPGKIYELN